MPVTDTPPALKARLPAGVALLNARDGTAAVRYFQTLLTEFPDHSECLDYLATAYFMNEQFEAADAMYRRCFELGARFPESLSNAARNAGRLRKYQHQLDYALQLLNETGPMRIDGLRQCAEALGKLNRRVEALAACKQLLLEQPDDIPALSATARQYLEMGMADSALATCQHVLTLQPDNRAVQLSRIEACFVSGDLARGFDYARALLTEQPDNLSALSALGFYNQFDAGMTVQQRREHAQRVGQVISSRTPPAPRWFKPDSSTGDGARSGSAQTQGSRVLKIGLVTADLRQHPVGFFVLGLLKALHGSSLVFTVFDPKPKHDALAEQFKPLVTAWHDVAQLDDKALADLIRAEQIDILMDLQGFMTSNRLPVYAYRPAPVQVSWMGFQGTTGAPGLDYVLADPYCVPPGTEDEFVEQVVRLPQNTLCFTAPEADVPQVPPPALQNGYITFGSLNNPDKYNDKVLRLWNRVLQAVPDSRLLLRGSKFHSREYQQRFITRLQSTGLDLDRVTLEGPAPRPEFLKTYTRIDIGLDTFPCSGATTTAEALWAGVPVLSLRGDRMVWRMAHSILQASNMTDWLADNPDHFVQLAKAKAADLAALTELRSQQCQRVLASPLFNAELFAPQFEATLQALWRQNSRWGRR